MKLAFEPSSVDRYNEALSGLRKQASQAMALFARKLGRVRSYESAMQALGQILGQEVTNVGKVNSVPNVSAATIVRNLRTAQARLRATAVKLSKITPLPAIKKQHEVLITAVREYSDELNGIIVKVQNGGGAAATAAIDTLRGVKDMQRALQAIAKAGYTLTR